MVFILHSKVRACPHILKARQTRGILMNKAISVMVEFIKVWFFMFFTYFTIKVLCSLILFGWVDLRRIAILELLLVPFGQSVAFWLVVKTFRKPIMKRPDRPT
jgi:hypothetical protein